MRIAGSIFRVTLRGLVAPSARYERAGERAPRRSVQSAQKDALRALVIEYVIGATPAEPMLSRPPAPTAVWRPRKRPNRPARVQSTHPHRLRSLSTLGMERRTPRLQRHLSRRAASGRPRRAEAVSECVIQSGSQLGMERGMATMRSL